MKQINYLKATERSDSKTYKADYIQRERQGAGCERKRKPERENSNRKKRQRGGDSRASIIRENK